MQNSKANQNTYDLAKNLVNRGSTVFPLSRKFTPAVKFSKNENVIRTDREFNQCQWMQQGDNTPYGVRTGLQANGRRLIIIDVDDNGEEKTGIDTLDALEETHGLLPDTFTVRTASGGFHLYFWTDVDIRNSASKVGNFIDVRGHNGFVVGPGCSRSGIVGKRDGYYEINDDHQIADMPQWLITLCTADAEPKSGPSLSPFDHEKEDIPVGQRNDHFFREASRLRGKGLDGNEILALLRAKNNTQEYPLHDQELDSIVVSALRYEPNCNEWQQQMEKIKKERVKKPAPDLRDVESLSDYDKALMVVDALADKESDHAGSELWKETLDSVFTYSRFTPTETEKLINKFVEKDPDGIGKRAIKAEIKHIKAEAAKKASEQDLTEMNDDIVKYLLDNVFEGLHYFKKGWWMYVGTHWAHVDENVIHNKMIAAFRHLVANRFETKDNHVADMGEYILEKSFPTMLNVLTPLMRASFKYPEDADPLNMCKPMRQSYVNFTNGTLWLTKEGVELKPHAPTDHILNCLEYAWDDVGGETPEWDALCSKVFPEDTAQIQRHLEEVCGYILQNTRFLRAWFYFVGGTGALKSAVASVLTEILRTGTVARRFKDLVKDSHGIYSLIGKKLLLEDDWPKADILPDGFLKTIAEEKMMTGNPKGEKTINFNATVAPLICANNWIKTRDTSGAVHDRAVIIPFATIPRTERSYEARNRMLEEIPQLIPKFIAGALRVMNRGDWDFPKPCQEAFKRWTGQSTPINIFISDMVVKKEGVTLALSTAYRSYTDWHRDNNPGAKPMGRNSFAQAMDDVLGDRSRTKKQQNIWVGYTLKFPSDG